MSNIPFVFASNDALEIKKVLQVLGLRINLDRMENNDAQDFDTILDGIEVKGTLSKVQNYDTPFFHISFKESDIDELIAEYISKKSGVPFLDTDRKSDDAKVKILMNLAIHDHTHQNYNVPSTKKLRRIRATERTASSVLRDLEIRVANLESRTASTRLD